VVYNTKSYKSSYDKVDYGVEKKHQPKKSYEDDYKSLYEQVDNKKYDVHEDSDEKEYRSNHEHESHYDEHDKENKYKNPEPKKI